jgi:triacylglycerol lipase
MLKLKTQSEIALLMANLSNLSYTDNQDFTSVGYNSFFIDNRGSQAYFLYDDTDVIIVCRGTQPNKLDDIVADIQRELVPNISGSTKGHVHKGFQLSVNNIWNPIKQYLLEYRSRDIWFTGHSLGAAMSTIAAGRCSAMGSNPTLYTFGSPRVGNKEYVESCNVPHSRWVNNIDIVTSIPTVGYTHHGTLYYFDHDGNIANLSVMQTIKDRIKGLITGISKGRLNYFVNHYMSQYIRNIGKL